MKLVFLGPPGAGKGTQAARLAKRFGLRHASTGEIFRQAADEGSEIGRTVRDYLDSGRLVPDELTSRVVEELVVAKSGDYILDGYPRTLGQARDLEAMLQRRGEGLDRVLYFEIGDEEAVRRLTGRLVCSECGENYHKEFMPPRAEGICDRCGGQLKVRSDSSEEVVRQRLAEYDEKTKPLVPFYVERGLLAEVDASQAPGPVTRQALGILDGIASN
ncbi:MAG: adenylate kinase [Planctomycetota bacterium]|jgi:adenylate kinase